MRYVLRKIIESETVYYVYSDGKICHKLKNAKVFKTLTEITDFVNKQNGRWSSAYETIAVTQKDLFKAKLDNT